MMFVKRSFNLHASIIAGELVQFSDLLLFMVAWVLIWKGYDMDRRNICVLVCR